MPQRHLLAFLILLFAFGVASAQTQYDSGPSAGGPPTDEGKAGDNDPPLDIVQKVGGMPPTSSQGPYERVHRRKPALAVRGAAPPDGETVPASPVALPPRATEGKSAPPEAGDPSPGRFMRPLPDAKIEIPEASYDELQSLAVALLTADESTKAGKVLARLDAMRPDQPGTLFSIGRVLSMTGDHARASLLFTRARKLGFDPEEAGQAILWNYLAAFVRAKDERTFDRVKASLLQELHVGIPAPKPASKPAPPPPAPAAGTTETRLPFAESTAEIAARGKRPAAATPDEETPFTYGFPLDRKSLDRSIRDNLVHHIPERDTPRAIALLDAAYALRKNGDHAGAAERLEELLARLPDHFDALLLRGDCLRDAGDADKARKEFVNAAFVRPLDPRPLVKLARLALDARDYVAARELAGRAESSRPDFKESTATLDAIDEAENAEMLEAARLAQERARPAAARPAAHGAPRPHGFAPESALELAENGTATFLEPTALRRGNDPASETVAAAPAGAKARVVARVGRFLHVEILEESAEKP